VSRAGRCSKVHGVRHGAEGIGLIVICQWSVVEATNGATGNGEAARRKVQGPKGEACQRFEQGPRKRNDRTSPAERNDRTFFRDP
jgi:hypothetical protein